MTHQTAKRQFTFSKRKVFEPNILLMQLYDVFPYYVHKSFGVLHRPLHYFLKSLCACQNERLHLAYLYLLGTRYLTGECSGDISHGAISHKNQRYKIITQSFDFRPYLCLESFYILSFYAKGKVHIQKSST